MTFQRKYVLWLGCLFLWSLGTGLACQTAPPTETTKEPVADSNGNKEVTPDASFNEPTPDQSTDKTPTDTDNGDKPIKTSITFYKDVQPLLQKHCQNCHFKGGVAPFALSTYEEVKAQAASIQWSVANRRMPPWMPDDQCVPLKHSRRLSDNEIKTITEWVKGGSPAGDIKDQKPYTPTTDSLAWTSVELSMQKPYTPPFKGGSDDYHCFLTKAALTKNQELTGFQFIPGAKPIVHHVLIYSVSGSYAQQLAGKHKDAHWPCFTGQLLGQGGSKLLGVFVPGTDVVRFPENTGIPMKAGEHLVMEVHYNRSTLKTIPADQSKIRLKFAKTPVKYKMNVQLMVQLALNVPPGAKNHRVTTSINVPTNVKVWGFMPHMHKFGTKVDLQMTRGGNKTCMTNVPRWDYNWQQTFFFDKPLDFKKGDKVQLNCFYNNTTNKPLRWGDRTEDEMCVNFFFVSAP